MQKSHSWQDSWFPQTIADFSASLNDCDGERSHINITFEGTAWEVYVVRIGRTRDYLSVSVEQGNEKKERAQARK